jgi:hypothetical protein
MNPATRLMVDRLNEMATRGLSYREAAAELGASYSYVAAFTNRHSISLRLEKRGRPLGSGMTQPSDRERDMLKRYSAGETLESIGRSYRITRERVRQLLSKHYNVCRLDGGQAEIARKKKRDLAKKRDARSLKAFGCSYRVYKSLVRHADNPVESYRAQKRNASVREISWDLNLWQWWSIWQQSGHWNERGRGRDGYCMCRLNDAGPYSVDNIYIATAAENIQDYWADVKSGARTRAVSVRVASSPERAKQLLRAASERYRQTPKGKLRYELRRQGLSKEQRDAIFAQKFGALA